MEICLETTPTLPLDGRISKRCFVRVSPKKNQCAGNFTKIEKTFYVKGDEYSSTMRKETNLTGLKRVSRVFEHSVDELDHQVFPSDNNPTYEDPRDVILSAPQDDKPSKPPRRRRSADADDGPALKELKRKLSKKYESLIVGLMDRCEENVALLSEKESHIAKLRDKLKSVLEYNRLFAEENDRLRQGTLADAAGAGCRRCRELETRAADLEDQLSRRQLPERDPPSAVPLVEVCVGCAARHVAVTQLREQNARLHADVVATKDLLYRLNMQLSRYQASTRAQETRRASDVDALIAAGAAANDPSCADTLKSDGGTPTKPKVVELSSLLSAQALVPLFDAYQDNIQEKETLILDYEKQFESLNKKSKQVIEDNRTLQEKLASLEDEVLALSKSNKRMSLERETMEIEKKTLAERVEKAEAKLAEVYDLYEGKVQAMMRDYETLHREYFATRARLAAADGKMARVVPADLHERRVADCTRLLEELKHQYTMQSERQSKQLEHSQQTAAAADQRVAELTRECDAVREELKTAQKNCNLYRRAAEVFRARRAAPRPAPRPAPRARRDLAAAADRLGAIKEEIKQVKSRAYTSLEELERRMKYQERIAARAAAEHRRDLDRAHAALQHKDDVIRRLIENVADIEEVRLSQTNAHQRLQGIQTETPENSPETQKREHKLVPGHGGYYQDVSSQRRLSNR